MILQGHLGSHMKCVSGFLSEGKRSSMYVLAPVFHWAKVHLTETWLYHISRLHMSIHPHPSVSSPAWGSLHLCPRWGADRLYLFEAYPCPWTAWNMSLRGSDVIRRRYSTRSIPCNIDLLLSSITYISPTVTWVFFFCENRLSSLLPWNVQVKFATGFFKVKDSYCFYKDLIEEDEWKTSKQTTQNQSKTPHNLH